MLSVEPWLVEPALCEDWHHPLFRFSALSRAVVGGTREVMRLTHLFMDVSVLSVEPWLVEPFRKKVMELDEDGFSALSRAVVGGTRPNFPR